MSANKSTWFVYMIQTTKGLLYTGISTDVERRFLEHCASFSGEPTVLAKKGAKFFRGHQPDKIVLTEAFENRSQASRRESEIKKYSRAKKITLLSQQSI